MVDHKREDRTPPLASGMGVGRQQQQLWREGGNERGKEGGRYRDGGSDGDREGFMVDREGGREGEQGGGEREREKMCCDIM